MITIVIVDDHQLMRAGMAMLLASVDNFKVIGEAESGEEAIKLLHRLRPQVLLMDLSMPGMDGIEITKQLLAIDHALHIIAVASSSNNSYAFGIIRAGAKGYLTKSASPEELVASITHVITGQCYLSSDLARQWALQSVQESGGQSSFDQLSERELQTVMMIVKGMRAKSIADVFSVSTKTVNSYRYRIFEKLHINSDVELAILAIKTQLVDIDDLLPSLRSN